MGLITVGNGNIDHLCPAGLGGLRVAGDFCSCAVMHVHGGIGLLLADYFGCQLLVVDVYPRVFVLVGRSRADFRFLRGGMVSTSVH